MKLKYRLNNTKCFKTMFVLAVATCLMLIGYAALKIEVKVNGTANVSATSFDVKFETLAVTTGSVTPTTAAIISGNTTINFAVNLTKPGDFYEFTVNVKNNGSFNTKIGTVTKTPETLPKYLEYTATYYDGTTVKVNDQLASKTSKKIKVRVKYRNDLNPSDLPTTAPLPFSLVFALNYVQA